jgi:hypothetical protein
MPYDDDIDIHVDMEHKEYLFSQQCFVDAQAYGIETIFLAFNTTKSADRHGSACRVRSSTRLGQFRPVIDIFFLQDVDGKVCKVDGWKNGSVRPSTVEVWDRDDIYPRREDVVDGMHVMLPNKPTRVVTQQYGPRVWDGIISRPILFSHLFPFEFLWALWHNP